MIKVAIRFSEKTLNPTMFSTTMVKDAAVIIWRLKPYEADIVLAAGSTVDVTPENYEVEANFYQLRREIAKVATENNLLENQNAGPLS